MNQSLRVRIALLAGTFAALFCLVVSVFVVVAVRDGNSRHGQNQIMAAMDQVQYHFKQGALPSTLVRSGDEAVQVLNPQGRVVSATPQLAGRPPMATFVPAPTQVRAKRTLCPPAGLEGCMAVLAYKLFRPDGPWLMYAAIPVNPWYANSTLAFSLAAGSLLLIVLMSVGGYHVVGRTLAPVNAIRAQMDEITVAGLAGRRVVPVPRNRDEIRMLATSVNAALDRLAAACSQLRRFTSDASHEVRSPLTAMRAQVEEALMYPDDTDWPEVGQAVLAAVDRLQLLVTELLFLARLDAGPSLTTERTDLARLVESDLDRRSSPVNVVRRLQKGVFAQCDPLRMSRLLANLMDNAERHARSQIMVSVRADGSSAIMEVADDGPGIAPEARKVVFERFTRLDTARDREAGGFGLGLAIAREIAEVHRGTLTIEDSERGARFVLRLPRCDVPSAGDGAAPCGPAVEHDLQKADRSPEG
ncbi:sensor histidine kinase [Actinomadura scrupuli]|uniref:sensor histidine kinase n=1 Tax=Actinomadura scrupuli TaxID=559629 RepID=UPI003D95A8C0